MTFSKTLSALVIASAVFSTNVFSMGNEDENVFGGPHNSTIPVPIKEDVDETTPIIKKEKEKNCSHWGLSHWVSGIGEYLQIMACCTVRKEEGVYKKVYKKASSYSPETYEMSDCYFDYSDFGSTQNWCKAFFCCPFAAITHLCCLPCACCSPSKKNPEVMDCVKELGYVPPIQTDRDYSGPITNNKDNGGAAAWAAWNRRQQQEQESENYKNFLKQQERQRLLYIGKKT